MAGRTTMILDTCALLWLAAGDRRLSRGALRQINAAPAVYVSAISGFEVALKAGRGRLDLPLPPGDWFQKVTEHHGLSVLPLELDVCIAAAQLPPFHEDPCDRFIIAAARLAGIPVVTVDERFEKYGVVVIN
jgi:PIN domain nuclease of toxin-antitoxin system